MRYQDVTFADLDRYWYLYLTGEDGVPIDFNLGSLMTAMEAGGPMARSKSKLDARRANAQSGGMSTLRPKRAKVERPHE